MDGITEQTDWVSVPAQAGTDTLPCLRSNNCIGEPENTPSKQDEKTPAVPVAKSAFKTEFCLKTNIEIAAEKYGIGHLAFFTPTFAKPTYCAKVAQKRMHSLITNVIRPRYGDRYIAVFERHESGAIHFHFVVHVGKDIRTGFDWPYAQQAYEAQKQRNFIQARKRWAAAVLNSDNGDFLRGEWTFWRGLQKRYRWLGRCEMLPIRSTAEAVARYTGGYIAKHMEHRKPEDKGVRLVRYGKGMRWAKSLLAFNSPKAWLWRQKLEAFALENGCGSMDALKEKYGKRWAYHFAPAIQAMPLLVRIGNQIIDIGKFDARTAQELCTKNPRVSALHYRPARMSINPEAQVRHDWKAGNLSLVRSVFGEDAHVV